MTIQDHPSFAVQFQRLFIWVWLIDTGLFASSLYSLKHHFMMLGWTLAVGFGVFTVFILGYGYYQLFHITCPNCGGELLRRPIRPVSKLGMYPPSTERVFKPEGCSTRS